MKKASVTYVAPQGDSKVVEMHGYTFFDGKTTDVVLDDDTMSRLEQNAHFKVSGVADHKHDDKPHDDKPDKPDKVDDKPKHK